MSSRRPLEGLASRSRDARPGPQNPRSPRARVPGAWRGVQVVALACAVAGVPRVAARADDAAAPSLALPTDRARSEPRIALAADPAAAVFGVFGPRAGFALGRHHAVWASPSFVVEGGRRGAALELAYALMPLGRFLEGPRLAVIASAARFPGGGEPAHVLRVGGEAGYAHLFGRLYVGGALGAVYVHDARAVASGERPSALVVRVELGWVFL